MRILLTGATGFIGSRLAAALQARGHAVVPVLRRVRGDAPAVQADFAQPLAVEAWRPHLAGIDAVVNAVGIIREDAGRSFQALHADAPAALFRAAAAAGVPCVVQVSALGADGPAWSRYHRSKRAADDVLRSLPVRGAVVQPSLVYGPGGASAALFEQLAVLPLLAFPQGGRMLVQPVHVDDVVAGIVRLLEAPPDAVETLAFAGDEPLPVAGYLQQLRTALGEPGRLHVLEMPTALFLVAARIAAHIPGSVLDGETARMLVEGNATSDNALPRLLGRPPLPVSAWIAPADAPPRRAAAHLATWVPALRFSLAAMWIWTAIVSFGLYPVAGSLELLARVGLHGTVATVALYGAAALDLLLGIGCIAAPARWRHRVWLAQALLVLGYTALITVFLPEQWLHPYGPVSKNLPLLAAIGLLWALERPAAMRR